MSHSLWSPVSGAVGRWTCLPRPLPRPGERTGVATPRVPVVLASLKPVAGHIHGTELAKAGPAGARHMTPAVQHHPSACTRLRVELQSQSQVMAQCRAAASEVTTDY